MKPSDSKKITFNILEKMSMEQAMMSAMQQSYDKQFYEKHKKQLCQTIYLIQISFQNEGWILLKTGKQCQHLLRHFYDSNQHFNKFVKKIQGLITHLLPFPTKNDLTDANLIECLNALGQKEDILENDKFSNFIEFGNLFERHVYRKFITIKKNGGRYKEGCCSMGTLWTQWKKRQVSIQYNGITYKNEFGQIKEYLPFSHGFEYFFGKAQTGLSLGVILVSNHRRLVLQTQCIQDYVMFLYLLRKKTIQSPYFNINRFNSFAPPRESVISQFYIDGKQYFDALSESIQKAKRSIYMTGWMISPEFLVKRAPKNVSLFDLLKQKVNDGVQVNILVYHESSFLPNDSLWVKEKFESLGHKVKVIRHPTGKLPILWSHHSKMVIIDKEEAFFGGLDLCYGRYDCSQHEIFPKQPTRLYPGIEYNNCRFKDIDNVRKFTVDHIDKRLPRLPWHDICQSVKGLIVSDFVHHFVEIWNFASYENRQVLNKEIIANPTEMEIKTIHNIVSTKDSQLEIGSDSSEQRKKNKKILTILSNKFEDFKNISKERIAVIRQKLYPEKKKKLQQLYRKKKIYAASNNFEHYMAEIHKQLLDMQNKQNNEWKSKFQEKENCSPSIKRIYEEKRPSLIQGHPTRKNQPQIDEDYMINLKKLQIKSEQIIAQVDEDIDSEEQGPAKIWQNNPFQGIQDEGQHQCQLLRSVGNWSIGCSIQKTQFSIHIGYLQLIAQAKHYIYIQNQFFISSTPETKQVKNQIFNALFRRIKLAIHKKQAFKVFVMLPLLPAFAGDVQNGDSTFLRMIMDWQYKTIRYLVSKVQDLGVDWKDYIQFLGLRTHGVNSEGTPTTEIIYVHSKLMIVDDSCTIIGSANINDRSLLGDRDSQIAVVTYGTDIQEGKMAGKKSLVSKKIKQFRMKLWRQHFGFQNDMIDDPIDQFLWEKIRYSSQKNTEVYRKIFGCYPDNQMKTLKDLKSIKQKSSIKDYDEEIKGIYGNVTEYPYNFLINEPIPSSVISKEYFIPKQCLI